MIKSVDISSFTGLTEEEVQQRLKTEGYNELPSSKRKSIFTIAWEIIKEPMFLLLIAGGVIYLILGEPKEAIMLLSFVFVIMAITFYQEKKTERALEALKDLSSPRALVIRDGETKRIAGKEVVRDDIIILSEGDRVPADAAVLHAMNMSVDESLLTGESVPVHKYIWDEKTEVKQPGGEGNPFIYSGTLVVQGQGIAKVYATGVNTELGKIGKSLQSITAEETMLQKETGRLVKNFAFMGIILCTLLVVVYGITRYTALNPSKSWIDGLLAGIALAMAMLPEEFPVVLTIFLALGAWRMSKKNVLTRKPSAIESLGAARVLCVDKTGTLTMNQMTVTKIFANGSFFNPEFHNMEVLLPENFHRLVEYSILASQKSPFDPMEKAIKQLGEYKLKNTEHIHEDWELIQEYPLSKELLAMSNVWQIPLEHKFMIAAKGAPEAIMDLCHVDEKTKKEILKRVIEMADEGLRVLGVAHSQFEEKCLPEIQHDFDFEFLGLIGLSDPIRPTVPGAIKECYQAGIRVIMITGDYSGTAQNIGRQIGLKDTENVITGPELLKMKEDELEERIKNTNIFARVVPEQKLIIVNALKALGEVVAMTGDGVNDAPALKSSNIGIAMGARGTDVAREASDLVLLDDDFSSIVAAVKMGRRIYDNLRKAMTYIIAIHVPIAGIALIPVLFNAPLVLLPVHIVFLELIIDPACSVVFEAENDEPGIMNRPPRRLEDPMFGKKQVIISVLQGLSVLFITLAVYWVSKIIGGSEDNSRAITFTTLIIANIGLILSNRSWNLTLFTTLGMKNSALWWVLGGAVTFLALVLYTPFLRNLFHFDILHAGDVLIAAGAGIFSVLWFEGLKILNRKKAVLPLV